MTYKIADSPHKRSAGGFEFEGSISSQELVLVLCGSFTVLAFEISDSSNELLSINSIMMFWNL
jgi:hypothetical protein